MLSVELQLFYADGRTRGSYSPLKKKSPQNVYQPNFSMSITHVENIQTTRIWHSLRCTAFNGCQKTPGFWDTAPCKFVYKYIGTELPKELFASIFYVLCWLQWKWRQQGQQKCWQLYINLQDVTLQNAWIFISIPVRTCPTCPKSRVECKTSLTLLRRTTLKDVT
jgi:hypothetical protein